VNANLEFRNDGFLAIWRDLTVEPVWKYEELPPLLLPDVTGLDLFEVGDTELARAHWFWSRRPKLRFPERAAVMSLALCVLICLSIALVYWHHTSVPKRVAETIFVLFEVAVGIYSIRHRLKFLRWRREYERSVDRLIRTHHAGM
jgi:hypothetical protein